jgi:geranylgeranyl pyrophosphate synthase
LRALLGRPLEGPELDTARSLVRSDGAVRDAVDVAGSYVAEAVAALEPLGPSAAAAWLTATAHRLVARFA